MNGFLATALLFLVAAAVGATERPRVALETSKGTIVLELYAEEAPETVENFLAYVESGFYDGTLFHRVVKGFMIQGGGFGADERLKATRGKVRNEAGHGLSNARGTVAMARTGEPHSATAQFFINLVDNTFLDHRDETVRGWGYAVFGRVVEGMEVVDAIAGVPVRRTGLSEAQPLEPVKIERARRQADTDETPPPES